LERNIVVNVIIENKNQGGKSMEREFICQYKPRLGTFSESKLKNDGCPVCKSRMKPDAQFPQLRQSQMKGGDPKIVDDAIITLTCINKNCGLIFTRKK
jgi:hypothetical protein